MNDEKKVIKEMAEVIKHTQQLARNVVGANPSPSMMATDLYNKGYRKRSEVAREIFEEIEELRLEFLTEKITGADLIVKLFLLKKKYAGEQT